VDFERWLHVLPLRWRSLARGRQLDRDLDDEIAYHLEQQVEDLAACAVPTRRAMRVDPLIVLREP
jgi:hypothetical protein